MTTRSTLLAASALAAVTFSSLIRPAAAQAINGLYIGAGVGANFLQSQKYDRSAAGFNVVPSGTQGSNTGVAALGSIGYGFGNGLRVEVEGNYRYNRADKRNFLSEISDGGREQKYGPMVNVLYDFDPSLFGFLPLPVTPYVGVGAGYQWIARRDEAQVGFRFNSGVVRPGFELDGGTRGSFAYQGIIGLSFAIAEVPGLAITTEYRFLGASDRRTYAGPIFIPGTTNYGRYSQRTSEDYNHSLLLGVRYAFNAAPAPFEAEPLIGPRPTSMARTYLVFFDWDRADLTDRARSIIAEAARASQQVQTTRIMVSGNTDTTGTAQYNQGLSVRRAQNVAAQLVRDGVPRAAISTQGFGFSRLLVPTGPGVREPQNRRVEIVLQ